MRKEKKGIFKYVPLWALVLFGVALIALAVKIIARSNTAFADFFSGTVGRFIRTTFSYLTYIFPFSVAEMMLWFSPIIVAVIIYLAVRCVRKSWQTFARFISGFLALACTVYSLFTFSIGVTYYGTNVANKMGITRRDVSAEELYATAKLLVEKMEAELPEIVYPEGTYSAMPYSYDEMNDKLNAAYATVCAKYDGIDTLVSRTKPVILSPYWTYTHISGIYTFFTGEANVNTNYPDFVMVSSAAHEMAHQRGVVLEDEANFIAFVVCTSSDDPFMRYAGYLDVFQNVSSSLASASSELYAKLYAETPSEIKDDLNSYAIFFDKYRENVAADISTSVNNTYIESNNQPAGVKSYGMVVDLVVSYMLYEN